MVLLSRSNPSMGLPCLQSSWRTSSNNWWNLRMIGYIWCFVAWTNHKQPSTLPLLVSCLLHKPVDRGTPLKVCRFCTLRSLHRVNISSEPIIPSPSAQHVLFHIGRMHQYIFQDNKDEPVEVVPQLIVHHIREFCGALVIPKGINKYSKRPHYILNAVFEASLGLIGICLYPDLSSILLNTSALPSRLNIFSTFPSLFYALMQYPSTISLYCFINKTEVLILETRPYGRRGVVN